MDEDPELQDVREWYIIGRRVHNPFASDANLVERFDRKGNVEFLSDCSHALAGRTVPLVPLNEGENDA